MAYNVVQPGLEPAVIELAEEDKEKLNKIDKLDTVVDDHSDQKINGKKTFSSTVTATAFKLADGREIRPTAVQTIVNNRASGILISNGDDTITAATNLAWDGTTLSGINLRFNNLYGSAENLTDIPAQKLRGTVPAKTLDLRKDSGLAIEDDQLTLSFQGVGSIKMNGQTLADADSILVYDNSHNRIRKSTLQAFYKDYINSKIHHPTGEQNTLQFKRGSTFGSSRNLTFDGAQNILNIHGQLSTLALKASERVDLTGPLFCTSANHQNITTISNPIYEVSDNDYTILVDLSNNHVSVILPDAALHKGRILNLKTIHSKKYILKSHTLIIKSAGGSIDLFDEIKIKMTTACRSLQSDGENWWVISSRGS